MGCSARSAIVPDGANFRIIVSGKSGFISSGDLKIKAYKQAALHCSSHHERLEIIEDREQRAGILGKFPEAELIFRCIP